MLDNRLLCNQNDVNGQPLKILIVKLSSIGDVVMATGVARVLRQHYPNAHITWVVEPKSADAILDNPNLDDVIILKRSTRSPQLHGFRFFLKQFKEWQTCIRELRSRHFDIAIDLQGLARSALVSLASGAKIRVGFAHGQEGSRFVYNRPVKLLPDFSRPGEAYVWMLSALGIETSDCRLEVFFSKEAETSADHFLLSHDIKPGEPYFCVCPATTWAQKHWIDERWSELIDQLYQKYGYRSVILGGPSDLSLASRIADRCSHRPVNAVGQLSLKGSTALLNKASLAISVDTGLLFNAMAQKTPVIGLFGPTKSSHIVGEPGVRILMNEYPCSPCRRGRHTCTEFVCMQAIHVDDVLDAVDQFITIPA